MYTYISEKKLFLFLCFFLLLICFLSYLSSSSPPGSSLVHQFHTYNILFGFWLLFCCGLPWPSSLVFFRFQSSFFYSLLNKSSWTNADFQSRFRVDKTKQVKSSLIWVNRFHDAFLSTFSINPDFNSESMITYSILLILLILCGQRTR